MERKTLEQQLFTWEGWDEGVNTGDLQFMNVELVTQVGEFPAGTKFPRAYFAETGSFIVFIDEKQQDHIYDLTLTAGRKLTREDFPEHGDDCDCGHDHG